MCKNMPVAAVHRSTQLKAAQARRPSKRIAPVRAHCFVCMLPHRHCSCVLVKAELAEQKAKSDCTTALSLRVQARIRR